MPELPEPLRVLLSDEPHLQVFGPQPPWRLPDGWLEERRARVKALVEDPRFDVPAARQPARMKVMKPDAPLLAQCFYTLIWDLFPPVSQLTGPAARLFALLLPDYVTVSTKLSAYDAVVLSSTGAWLPRRSFAGLRDSEDLREGLVEFHRQALDLLADVPVFEPRRTVLAGCFDRVAADPALLAAHRKLSHQELTQLWRRDLLADDVAFDAFPEYSGNPLDLLVRGVQRLQPAFEQVAATTPETEEAFPQHVAEILLQAGRTDVPAGLSLTSLGAGGAAEIQRAFERTVGKHDRAEWSRSRRGWLARAAEAGGAEAARQWIASAYLVGATLKGLPGGPVECADLQFARGFVQDLRSIFGLRRTADRSGDPAAPDATDPMAELGALIGLDPVKAKVTEIVAEAKVAKLRTGAGMTVGRASRHLVFSGNPGTGKTTVARLIADIYRNLGVLSSGHLVEVTRTDLIGSYIGQTAPKVTEVVRSALGGVLFIDEAYALFNGSERDYGREAVAVLIQLMEEHRDDLVVVMAGYPREMYDLLESNPGLKSRIQTVLTFPDYTDEQLHQIFRKSAADAGFTVSDEVSEQVLATLRKLPRAPGFGNGRAVRSLLDQAAGRQAVRLARIENPRPEQVRELRPEDLPATAATALGTGGVVSQQDAQAQLAAMIGLDEVKEAVRRLAAEANADVLRAKAGMPPTRRSRHLVFVGNPGTGKTSVARLIAGIYRDLGLLGVGHLVECAGGDLIADRVGATAPLVRKIVEKALGGVLFIDEAYTVADREGYGPEAVAALIQLMETHRDDLVVVLAGYPSEMEALLDSNSGLRSRVPTTLDFPDYSVAELARIFRKLATDAGYAVADEVVDRVGTLLAPARGDRGFGNARQVRNVFEAAIAAQAVRITGLTDPSAERVRELLIGDLPETLSDGGPGGTGLYI